MNITNTKVFNFEGALRGMRNPMNSWSKNDTKGEVIGPNDADLAMRLIKAGPEHRKFLRQIFVTVDITAPLYWWSEFDTYKVGTAANSCSTMHKLASRYLEEGDFEPLEHEDAEMQLLFQDYIEKINTLMTLYKETKDEKIFRTMKGMLPASYLQKRTVTLNYENLLSMYHQRKSHRLPQWRITFCNWVKSLPNAWLIVPNLENTINE